AKLATDVATAAKVNEDVVETQVAVAEDKQPKAVKADVVTAKSSKVANSKSDTAADNGQSAGETGAEEAATVAAKTATETVEASTALPSATTTKAKSVADESSDDDSHTGSKNDAPTIGTDTSAVASKVDTAQLAGSIPNTTDVAANT